MLLPTLTSARRRRGRHNIFAEEAKKGAAAADAAAAEARAYREAADKAAEVAEAAAYWEAADQEVPPLHSPCPPRPPHPPLPQSLPRVATTPQDSSAGSTSESESEVEKKNAWRTGAQGLPNSSEWQSVDSGEAVYISCINHPMKNQIWTSKSAAPPIKGEGKGKVPA